MRRRNQQKKMQGKPTGSLPTTLDSSQRQAGRSSASQRIAFFARWTGKLRTEEGVSVLINLFGSLKVFFVAPIVFEFALDGRVIATDLRSCLVNATSIVILQVFAGGVDEQVPVVVFNKNGRPVVQQVPTHEVEIPAIDRYLNRQRKIMATFGGAVFAEVRVVGKLAA